MRRTAGGGRFGRNRNAGGGGDSVQQDESADQHPPDDRGSDSTSPKQRAKARFTAVGLLARREHAQSEIQRKLQERGYDRSIAEEVVDELTRQRLLSDDRFAESFIRSRANRGQGPVRLRAELRQLKLTSEMIERHVAAAGVQWEQLAREIRERRFGRGAPATLSERAKQVRFLQYRGFTAAHIRVAMGSACDELLDASDSPEFDPE